jgi:hypothetical protein
LFAFGGAYTWATIPLIGGTLLLAAARRPSIFRRGERWIDGAVAVCLVVAALQLVDLPAALRLRLAPALAPVDRALRLDAPADPWSGRPAPMAIDRGAGIEWMAVAVGVTLYFWCARDILRRGSIRQTVRSIAACGGIAAALALAQHVTAPRLLYWIWRPMSRNAEYPFTPFVNRNDMAGWMVLALPLAAGYLLARLEVRREGRLESAFDRTGVWLGVAVLAMAGVLVATLSRSGLTAAAAAAGTLILLSRRRLAGRGRARLLAAIALVALVGAAYANVGALMTRVGETLQSGVGGRREIWETTLAMIRDFPLTGVGVGSYQRAMTVYQPVHVFAFNHAHNEYLQLLAEGGLLFCVPAACAAVAGIWRIARLLGGDRTPMFWIRAGATSALAAMAVQSLWETGLRMPANAVLFALCAAVALQDGTRES